MRPAQEIVDQYTDEETDNVDLGAVIQEMSEALREQSQGISPAEQLGLLEAYIDWGFRYIGGLVLQIADEVGALPNGPEVEFENFAQAMSFNKVLGVYEFIRQRRESARGLQVAKSIPSQ